MGRGGSLSVSFLCGRELACTDILAFTLASKGREVFLNGYSARVTPSATRRTKHRARSMAPPDVSTITRSYELHLRLHYLASFPGLPRLRLQQDAKKRSEKPSSVFAYCETRHLPVYEYSTQFFFQVYIEPCALRLMHPWFNFPPLFLSTCSMQN